MSDIKIRFVAWRGGRPRFVPGPGLRKLGYRGRDLRHGDGTWFGVAECIDWVTATFADTKFNKSMERFFEQRERREDSSIGYVYFLRSGQRIKVGWSKNPAGRLRSYVTALSGAIDSMTFVPGTRLDEQQFHRAFDFAKVSGEWFRSHRLIRRHIFASIDAGHVVLPELSEEAKNKIVEEIEREALEQTRLATASRRLIRSTRGSSKSKRSEGLEPTGNATRLFETK